jgi:hypothetical protein
MKKFDELYENLEKSLEELFNQFIKPFVVEISTQKYKDKDVDINEYKLKIQAYIVLSHATFENYFEEISLELMKKAFDEWTSNNTISDVLLMQICYFLSYHEGKERVMNLEIKKENNKTDLTKITQYLYHIDNLKDKAKTFFYQQMNGNHGISLDYLLHIFIPVAININQDPDMMNSLKKLKESRGEMAHKNSLSLSLTKIPTPTEIFNHVCNCLELCKDIKTQCNNK